jgi:hypothetical protein
MAANSSPVSNNSEGRTAPDYPDSVRNIVNNIATQYNTGIFFDNDKRHIIEVSTLCNSIKTVKIPESAKPYVVKKIEDIGTYFAGISTKLRTIQDSDTRDRLRGQAIINRSFTYYLSLPDFSENLYTQCIYDWAKYTDTVWDFKSGIGDGHISQLNEWIAETAEIPNRVAIFDWDRTLTQFEGLITYMSVLDWIKSKQTASNTNATTILAKFHEDTLIFLLGGIDRLTKIRTMLHDLQERGIAVCILTNNRACNNKLDNPIYVLTAQLLGNTNFTLICSRPEPFKGNKGLTLQYQPKFAKLCAKTSEGGYRHRTRQLRTQKRKSQKRKSQKRKRS